MSLLGFLFSTRPTRELALQNSIALMLEMSEVLTSYVASLKSKLQETNEDYLVVFEGCKAYLPRIGSDRAIHYQLDAQRLVTIVVFFEDTVKISVHTGNEVIHSQYIRVMDLARFGGDKTLAANLEGFKLLINSVFELCRMLANYNSRRFKEEDDGKLKASRNSMKKLLGLK